jgi:hypothetical protein
MEVNSAPPAYAQDKIAERKDLPQFEEEGQLKAGEVHDAFGNEEYAEIKYKTLKWWYVSSGNKSQSSTVLTCECLQAMWLAHDL